MANVKATFYLPLKDNVGRDLGAEISQVEDRCFIEFGGWTQLGFFKGAWRMVDGERRFDTCAVYSILLPASRIVDLELILCDFKVAALQEAIYLEIEHQVDVRFL